MYDRLTIEVALGTLASGGTVRQAARAAGVGRSTVNDWAHGRLPSGTGGALDAAERAAYEAAMTENMLLRAVLDDLKAAGSHPLSISNRRKCELGERLREATGLPLREVTAFLRISRSSYEYHRARLGADKYAGLRAEVRALFAEMGGGRGYRPVWAELRRRGTRVSEKVVRRIMQRGGPLGLQAQATALELLRGRGLPGPAEPAAARRRHARLLRPRAERAVGHRHHRVPPPLRREGLPQPRRRLLRRAPRRLVVRPQAHGGPRGLEPGGRVRHARARRAAGRPLRPRGALPLARLGRDLRGPRARAVDVAQGLQPRQRAHGGLLRHAQVRVLPPEGLVGRGARGVPLRARRLDAVVQGGARLPGARLAHARRAPQAAGLRGVACTRKRPQSPVLIVRGRARRP